MSLNVSYETILNIKPMRMLRCVFTVLSVVLLGSVSARDRVVIVPPLNGAKTIFAELPAASAANSGVPFQGAK